MRSIRVMVADHHSVFREGLSRLLEEEEDMECIATVGNTEEILRLVKDTVPDILLIDVNMPSGDVIPVISEMNAASPATHVVIITHDRCEYCVFSCMQAGADGYLLKDINLADLLNSIRMVNAGEVIFDKRVTCDIFREMGRSEYSSRGAGRLHHREVEALRLASRGMSNRQIAQELCISERTVATHFFNIFRKLKVETRTEAVTLGIRQGLISIDETMPPSGDEPH